MAMEGERGGSKGNFREEKIVRLSRGGRREGRQERERGRETERERERDTDRETDRERENVTITPATDPTGGRPRVGGGGKERGREWKCSTHHCNTGHIG